MKILISGGAGFIGGHLIKRLTADGHELAVIVRANTKKETLQNLATFEWSGDVAALISYMQKEKFDGVIHLASTFLAKHEPGDVKTLIDSNLLFATSLLESAVQSKIPWFINTGTFWQHYESADYSPVNLYAATKQAFEDIAKYYVQSDNTNFVTIKLNDTFGPNDTRSKILNLLAKIAASGEALAMSPGEQIIDISYVGNVIDGYVRMMELLSKDATRKLNGKSYAIRSHERMTLKELASLFEKTLGKKLNIEWGKREYRPREVMVPWEKGEIIPGWKPKVSLEEGIRRTFKNK